MLTESERAIKKLSMADAATKC